MIVLDTTIVNVALPTIGADLGFSDESLSWVVNAYLLTFGGFLLLGGRLGDLFGHRRLFLAGIVLFTLASLGCGLANGQELLVVARAVQGVGGAVVSAVALSLVLVLFPEPADRAKAMGIFGFVLSGGGTAGVLLGGVLTDLLSWHWIFLVNVPIGVAVYIVAQTLVPAHGGERAEGGVDYAGAICVTGALMLAVYGLVNANEAGWTSLQTLGLIGAALVLIAAFFAIEAKARSPLVPLGIFRLHNLRTANVMGILMAAGMFTAFFLTTLYLTLVLEFSALEVGFTFLPSTVLWGAVSLFLSDKLVMRYGLKKPMVFGFTLFTLGIVLLARAPTDGSVLIDVVPAMVVQGIGAGVAFNPLLLAAMGDVQPHESGLASGVVNTAFMMGGALGLAVLASIAAARTESVRDGAVATAADLNSGYHVAFLVGAVLAAVGVLIAAFVIRDPSGPAPGHAAGGGDVPPEAVPAGVAD